MAIPKKGVSMMQEENNGEEYVAGLYRHPVTGAELVTKEDPLFGNAQSEAVVRVGFERVGDTPTGYEKTLVEVNASTAKTSNASEEDLKGLQARLKVLEAEKESTSEDVATPEAVEASVPTEKENKENKKESK